MATTKTVNYTDEQTTKMVADYQAGVTTEVIALALGKTVRSVVAKLSKEKVYIAKVYKTKAGESVVKKDSLADNIGSMLKLAENDIESLTKATKPALVAIMNALLAVSKDTVPDTVPDTESDSEFESRMMGE